MVRLNVILAAQASSGEEMFVDIGVYGVPGIGSGRPGKTDFVASPSCQAVEQWVRQVDGFQMLYADMYVPLFPLPSACWCA
jgi:hypothetical protein